MGDAGGDTRWVAYEEVGAVRGISRGSATRLAMRRHWARRTGNDRKTRVAVPFTPDMSPPDIGEDISPVITPDITPDKSSAVRVITEDVSPLHEPAAAWRELVDVLRDQ